jgi:hypothetical protein
MGDCEERPWISRGTRQKERQLGGKQQRGDIREIEI